MNNRDSLISISLNKLTFIPERLKGARQYRGLSQTDLASELGFKRQAISNYETKSKIPSTEILLKISKVLDFPFEFFFKQQNCEDDSGITYFRSQTIPAKKKERYTKILDYLAFEILDYFKKYIILPKVELIDVRYQKEYSYEEINEIVKALREKWKLGLEPIKNLILIMEEHGCIITKMDLETSKTDGYSKWIYDRPFTIINSEVNSSVRTRFTLAHELGHIVLHKNLPSGENLKAREAEAHYFAGEFLFPSEKIIDEVGLVNLDYLLALKQKWGISVGALVRRCYDNELITDDRYTLLQKQISKRKWRTAEPLDDIITVEEPNLFREALELLIDNKITTKEDFQKDITFSERELIEICNLPKDFFHKKMLRIKPDLKVIK